MDKARLDAIKASLAAVTPGEWWQYEGDFMSVGCTHPEYGELIISEDIYSTADAAFIAAAPGMVRELVEEVERLTGLLDIAHSVLPREKADKLWLMWKHKGVAPDERKGGA